MPAYVSHAIMAEDVYREIKNDNVSKIIENRIESIKLELNKKHNEDYEKLKKENKLKEEELNNLIKEKSIIEDEKNKILAIKKNNKDDIDNIINNKAKEIALKFEKDKQNIEKENERLKLELKEMKSNDSNLFLNHQLKASLKNIIKEISNLTGLLADNKIMDEETLKEVNNLKLELKSLNKQTELYINQSKF